MDDNKNIKNTKVIDTVEKINNMWSSHIKEKCALYGMTSIQSLRSFLQSCPIWVRDFCQENLDLVESGELFPTEKYLESMALFNKKRMI